MEKLYSPALPVSTAFPGDFLWSGEIQQHHVRALLHSLQHNFTPVWRDVEVAYIEIWRQVGQLPLGAGFQVEPPEVLVLNIPLQKQ